MVIVLAFLAGLLSAAAVGAVRRAGRRALRQLPGSNQDWVWY
ncbi:Uncharacterised protein [Xylophilus ampelinus]|jgi:hypothetical protein|nr:Uncharacterised protein [Xylophilus ampelinus]